jgi:hypothetical protein
MATFPLYLLELDDDVKVVFPETKKDIGHNDFWEHSVSHMVAARFHIPQIRLANLPYCQKRARICGNFIYSGGKPDGKLLSRIRKAVGNNRLVFVFDNHEKRLREDVLEFRRLVRRYRPKSAMT